MALLDSACARSILCGLSAVARLAMVGVIDQLLAAANALLAFKTAQKLKFDIFALPYSAAIAIAEGTVEELQQTARLLPLALVAGCTDLGDLNKAIGQVTQAPIDDLNALIERVRKYTTLSITIQGEIDSLEDIIETLESAKSNLENCGS